MKSVKWSFLAVSALSLFSSFAHAEVNYNQTDSLRIFDAIKASAEVIESRRDGYLKIAQGDMICTRMRTTFKDSFRAFDYFCSEFSQGDVIVPDESAPQVSRSGRSSR